MPRVATSTTLPVRPSRRTTKSSVDTLLVAFIKGSASNAAGSERPDKEELSELSP
eukprot:TRINITY_DN2361_c0_g2_i1.p3 TRINITY_DN2361_c0_g2~~TRINITY_DN2361_c0_g2_i1.p3  ORF type:complete len:55 (+),score=0.54 TRINITY_DN2361_c0_g2_i1:328-492(+)